MRDFTVDAYTLLITTLQKKDYSFQSVENFMQNSQKRAIVLRHDVDLRSYAALRLAQAEAKLEIRSTYYFRIVKQSYNPDIIRKIVDMGHEIGYHYEDLAKHNGNFERAIQSFSRNLDLFRQYYPVKTVCMHGSSGSPYDNRDIWKHYRLEDFDLICEPYLSIDYDKVLYLSDTGRRWNGFKMSLRDNVKTSYDCSFTGTRDIIKAVDTLPDQILFTAHPEQWTDNLPEWLFVKTFSIAHTLYKVHYRNRKVRGEI